MVPPKNNTKSGFRGGRDSAAIQENIELLTGQRGNGLDRAITMRELASLGLINVTRNSNGAVIPKPVPPIRPDINLPVDVPHSPVGFAAFGGFGAIMLEWENPTFNGFAHAEVWRASPNKDGSAPYLDQAVLIATTPATVFGDIVNPGSTFYYWCRFVNINDIAGPYNNIEGVKVSTSQNLSNIIDDIGKQMKESELIQALVIDISEGDKVSNAAIKDAKNTLNNTIAKVENEYKAADAILTGSISSLSQVLTTADQALAQKIEQVQSDYKGADTVTNAAVTTLTKTVSDGDSALAKRVSNVESAYKSGDKALSGAITALDKVTAKRDKVVADKVNTVQSSLNGVAATVQQHSQAISTINKDGSTAHKAMWNTKAQAGDIKAGIGILADSNGISQVAVSASQFIVFDPNVDGGSTQPLFSIDKGNVIIPKAFIEKATIQILNAQTIVADKVKVGISINSPIINGGQVTGGWAGFGYGGHFGGYYTKIHSNGTIETERLQMYSARSGSRLQIVGDRLEVWDGGRLRVRLGRLS
ncbi:hypothetical protein CTM97_21010 [Photobacterium phosphoreum]|uniref:Tip attachment protein J central straight fiber domain-containing protein n=1 Tax=Photobacterium phosphoreum TaxID=659 RepID=A0A2T3JBC9_PHOPO|nr:DUF1983 domain-containing protein [Photobacterium phosphoreum]PSU19622.1 hypothetical protein CTM96_21025 [Photobacterium phosphoreum]PSU37063.1 hypothetical protein CTM97_21010 [Photobacterium phosphoreum]PSU46159.1 hypothetical protein C9J18_21075 [Photobacterium phosphoreum]